MIDVVLLTEDKYINTPDDQIDWYVKQVLTEDFLVLSAIEKLGLTCVKKSWSDASFDWSQTKTAVFRTTWDYFHRFHEFSIWLDGVKTKTKLLNTNELVRWNMDKHYLNDLAKNGIDIVQSYFIEKGDQRNLSEVFQMAGWDNAVLKPCVSGAARHTYRLSADKIDELENIYSQLIENESMMLQPFMKQIMTKGEISLIVIGGKYSHAVLKKAKAGDYRVQDDWGGTVHAYHPSRTEISFAENCVRNCPTLPLYARVDIVWDNQDNLALSELELIEPELWFRNYPHAADSLAKEIEGILHTM